MNIKQIYFCLNCYSRHARQRENHTKCQAEELENPRLLVFNIDNNMERDALEEDIKKF